MIDEKTVIDVSDCKSHKREFDIFFTFAEAAMIEGLREKDEDKILYGAITKSILASIHCVPKDFASLVFCIFRNYYINDKTEFKSIINEMIKRETDIGRELDEVRDEFIANMNKLKELGDDDNE